MPWLNIRQFYNFLDLKRELTKSISIFDWQYDLQKKLQHPQQDKKN